MANRLNLINGAAAAWTDSLNLANYINGLAVFTDSAGKKLWGYILAADTAEALGTELLTADGSFTTDNGWTPGVGWTIAADVATAVTTTGILKGTVDGMVRHSLTVITFDYTRTGGTLYTQTGGGSWTKVPSGDSNKILYRTPSYSDDMTYVSFLGSPGFSGTIDNISIKRVLHLGTDAVLISSTPGGATRNWAGMDVGFNPNGEAMTFVVNRLTYPMIIQ